jgi:site-specific recombinase XerC
VPDTEFEAVYRNASPALQLALLLAREAGIRRGTIQRFCTANCDFGRRLISGNTKSAAAFSMPMTQRLYEKLLWACAGARDAQEPLLTQFHTGQRKDYSYAALNEMLQTARKRAGLNTRWTLHDLRRTLAREVYDQTHDLRKVQRVLSHSSPTTTLWYLGNAATDLDATDIEACTVKGKTA